MTLFFVEMSQDISMMNELEYGQTLTAADFIHLKHLGIAAHNVETVLKGGTWTGHKAAGTHSVLSFPNFELLTRDPQLHYTLTQQNTNFVQTIHHPFN